MAKHTKNFAKLNRSEGYTGKPLSSQNIGLPALRANHFLRKWAQQGPIYNWVNSGVRGNYTGTGVGDYPGGYTAGEGGDIAGNFYVILPQVPKRDTFNTYRELNGVLLPRSYNPITTAGDVTTSVKVRWREDDHATTHTLVETDGRLNYVTAPVNNEKKWGDVFRLYSRGPSDQKFWYEPSTTSSVHWTFGTVMTTQIETASLSIWPGPDWDLTDAEAGVLEKEISPGRIVKGYTGTAGAQSLGDLVQDIGGDSKEDYFNTDSVRPAFAWGHPVGVHSDTNSYKHLSMGAGSGSANYYVHVPKLWDSQATMACYPTALLTVSGAGVGDPAGLKIQSATGADLWTMETETDTAGAVPDLYDYTDASNDTLTVATDTDRIQIELLAPAGGEVHLHTLVLWYFPLGGI